MLPLAAWPWIALTFGVMIGSFSNVCIHRIPLRQSVVHPRSRCPRCLTMIAGWDNVPVLSWLFLGGRCRVCRAFISPRYPLVEALNGALYFGLALMHPPELRTFLYMAFATGLLILSLIDLDHKILPDVLTLPGTAIGLAASVLPGPPAPLESALAAAVGYGTFMLLAWTWRALRGIEALGQGDWKLAAMLGAFLGFNKLLLVVFFASLSGTLVGLGLVLAGRADMQERLPFGTFLGGAALVTLFVGEPLVDWYRQYLSVV